jgi:outer membrane protein OmpA-like peptidoglycan-associated protein
MARHIATVTVIGLVLGMSWAVAASEPKDLVNSFYKQLVDVLKAEDTSAEKIAELVRKNQVLAEKSLSILKERSEGNGSDAVSFRFLHQRLLEGLVLSQKGPDCSETAIGTLKKRVSEPLSTEDKIFLMENIIRLCPAKGTTQLPILGDLYFRERQFGMAAETYERALKLAEDPEVRAKMEEAQGRLETYKAGIDVSKVEVGRLFAETLMAPVKGSFKAKLEVRNAVQTNKILFDEWSSAIKESSEHQLKEVGEGLKESLKDRTGAGLLIEGHTDNRGPMARNMTLSKERAQAIRKYLAEKFGIDSSRIVIKGHGPHKPFSPRNDSEGWAMNRRVEFKKIDLVPNQ